MRRTAAGALVVMAMAAGVLAGGPTSLAVPGDSLTVVTVPALPPGVAALLVQFAMVDGDAPGYITAGACSRLHHGVQPWANGNHGVGATVANLAVIGVDPDSNFCVANSAPVDVVADVQGAFVDGSGDAFVPDAGHRLLDTRDRAVPPAAGTIEVVDTGVPAGTDAVLVNIAMVDASAPGYITADRCSTLTAGTQTRANGNHATSAAVSNLAVVPVDTDGRFCIYHQSAVQLVVDLQGRFVPAATTEPDALRFAASTLGRVLDTRDRSTTPPDAGTIEVVDTGAPAGTAAVLVNLAMVDATAPGYVTAGSCAELAAGPQARASGNHGTGLAASNLSIVAVDGTGRFCLYHQSAVHLVVDVQGTFSASATAGYVALAAARVLDTRPPAPDPATTTTTPSVPSAPSGTARTRCTSVVHIGDSTSVGMISSSLLPNPNDRMPAQYQRVGVTSPRMEISGARSTLETLPGQENAYQVAQRIVASGYHGCWVFALGTTDTANVAAGASPGRDWRIARMLALVGNDPVLWVNVATIETTGSWSNQQMQLWNVALRAAAPSHPNMVIYDWASVVQRSWFSADRVHYTSDGYRLRGAMIANALAAAFPA